MTATQTVTVRNPSGLHARPAAELARLAGSLASDVVLICGDARVRADSVLSLMAAAITQGTEVTVECSGESAEEDLAVLVDAIAAGLGELVG